MVQSTTISVFLTCLACANASAEPATQPNAKKKAPVAQAASAAPPSKAATEKATTKDATEKAATEKAATKDATEKAAKRNGQPAETPKRISATALVTPDDALTSLDDFEKETFVDPSEPRKIHPPNSDTPQPNLATLVAPTSATPSDSSPSVARPEWTKNLKLPDFSVRFNERLLRYLDYYRNNPRGRALIAYWLRSKGRYQTLIERTIAKYPVPKSLIYVAMIESSYRPDVTSRVGAAGLWQFMVSTGRAYGLEYDYWIDQRRDPIKSTDAAIRYLMALEKRLGNWELVLAAYNAGLGSVLNAVRKYNTNDYWRLCRYEAGLPWSTTLYVAKVTAVALVDLNREFFGFKDIKPTAEFKWELVKVSHSTPLSRIAEASGSTLKEIEILNPDLRRGRTPPRRSVWVRLPIGRAHDFYGNLATKSKTVEHYAPYDVRLGDNLKVIAQEYRLSQRRLKRLNGLVSARELRPGLTILVPARPPKTQPSPKKPHTEDDLLLVPIAPLAPTRVAGHQRIFYRVVDGDSLEEICRHLAISKTKLLQWNALDETAKPIAGLVLQAFVPLKFDARRVRLLDNTTILPLKAGSRKFLNTFETRLGRKRLIYAVRHGDSLRSISKRFGLSVGSLMRINKFGRSTVLQPGDEIIIYAAKPKQIAKAKRKRSRKLERDRRHKIAAAPPTRAKAKAKAKAKTKAKTKRRAVTR